MWLDFCDTSTGNSCSLAYSCLPSRSSALSEAGKLRAQTFRKCWTWLSLFLLAQRFHRDCLLVVLLRSCWNSSPGLSKSWRCWLDFFRTCGWRLKKRICSSLVTWLNLRVGSSADEVKTFRPNLKPGHTVTTPVIISRGCISSRAAMNLKLTTFSAVDGSNALCLHFDMFNNYLIYLCRIFIIYF